MLEKHRKLLEAPVSKPVQTPRVHLPQRTTRPRVSHPAVPRGPMSDKDEKQDGRYVPASRGGRPAREANPRLALTAVPAGLCTCNSARGVHLGS